MTESNEDPGANSRPVGVNPGYAVLQIAKALRTSEEHGDPKTRERARAKIATWETVLKNIVSGAEAYGGRTPVDGAPAWATLEVVTGGFATGALLAGGPLQKHEQALLKAAPVPAGKERRSLNTYFLTEQGFSELSKRLQSGCYEVGVPEEGAFLIVVWLVENGHADKARELLDLLSPHFGNLRFYPIPTDAPRRYGSEVHLQDVGTTVMALQKIQPNQRILTQKEAVEIWAPFYDRMVALFFETVEDDWPCRKYPSDWSARAAAMIEEYPELRKRYGLCGKPVRPQGHFAQLREFLARCAKRPESLTGREVGRIRLILRRYAEKRGRPGSEQCVEDRHRQVRDVSAPMFHQIAQVVIPRLDHYAKTEGVEDIAHLNEPLSPDEAGRFGIRAGTAIPTSIRCKVERCLNETVQELVKRDLITSGETLARVLPQMSSGLRAVGISNPTLRQLYAAIYRSFRRRRSLLLLNLEKQIQIEELPWVAAIETFRTKNLSDRELARQALEEISVLTITSFPHVIIPNKLVQELRALAKGAQLDIPLVEEVAADIFTGEFSGKFLIAAKRAADLLEGTLYASYYGIDFAEIRGIPVPAKLPEKKALWRFTRRKPAAFAQICAARAGVELGTFSPATNGMIIEQQQILTTQNLAALFLELGLPGIVHGQLGELAKECFKWVCKRQQMKIDHMHAKLTMIKNAAYAWRQMVFFLALLSKEEQTAFFGWAVSHLAAQSEPFRNRFGSVLQGVANAHENAGQTQGPGCFLGWSNAKHWLLTDA